MRFLLALLSLSKKYPRLRRAKLNPFFPERTFSLRFYLQSSSASSRSCALLVSVRAERSVTVCPT